MINCIVLMGRLTADPELRTTQSGVSVARFRIAVDRNYADQNGDRAADFISIVAWKQQAEFVSKYFHKGSMIAVQGELRMNKYKDRETGQNHTTYEVQANSVSFTGSKAESGESSSSSGGTVSYSNAEPDDFTTVGGDDDFPF